jgi:hypothetical protein
MPESGRLKFVIEIDDKGLPVVKKLNGEIQTLEKEATGATGKMSKGFAGMWAQMALGQAAFAMVQTGFRMITREIGSSIKMAIDAEETHSKFGTVFKSVSEKAAAAAKELADSWGVSKFASETMLSATGDLLTGLGLTGETALDLSLKTQKLAIDLASFTNFAGGASGASDALIKAMLGERESVKALGIVVTEEMVKEELLRVGKDKLTGMSLLQAKAEATLQIAMKQSANAMGDYARTQDSTANSIKRMQATWEDVKVEIGSAIVDVIGPALSSLKTWFEENKEAIVSFAKDALANLKLLADYIYNVVTALKTLIEWTVNAMSKVSEYLTIQGASNKYLREQMQKLREEKEKHIKVNTTEDLILEEVNSTLGKGVTIIDLVAEALKKSNEEERLAAAAAAKLAAQQKAAAEAAKNREKAEKDAAAWTEKFGSVTGGLTDAGRDLVLQLLEIGGYLPKFTAETQAAAEEQEDLAKRIRDLITEEGELTAVGEGVYIGMLQWAGLLPTVTDDIDDSGKATKKWTIDWKNANEVLQFSQSMISGVTDLLGAMGVELGEGGDAALQAASGIGQLWAGIQSGNPLAIIQGVTQALSGLLKLFKGDGVGEAITRENKWMDLTKQQIKQIRDLEKQYGSTHAATSDLLDQFIANADITTASFDQWANRMRGILSDLDQGKMTIAQTQKQIGDAFTALITKAKELGTEGSASLIAFYKDLENRGIQVAEVQQYINEQIEVGTDAYADLKDSIEGSSAMQEIFGNISIGVYDDIIAYRDLLADNQELVTNIGHATEAMTKLANAGEMNEMYFDQFSLSAKKSFDALIAGGMDSSQAIKAMKPNLQELQFLHEQYGYTIDANTQAILDQAIAEGTVIENKKSEQREIIDMLGIIAHQLGYEVPDALSKTGSAATGAFRGAYDEAHRFNDELDKMSIGRNISISTKAQGDYISAALGYQSESLPQDTVFQLHKGEKVSVIPAGQNSSSPQGGGSRQIRVDFYVYGEASPFQVARAMNTAIDGNVDGIASKLEEIK